MAHIRLFQSALADVRYVYDRPVPFPADIATRRETIERYSADKEAAELREAARRKALKAAA